MYQLVYGSSAVSVFSNAELLGLLEKSRKNNERLGITGMLLHKDGNFLQVLEGEKRAVRTLFEHIARDPRHKGIIEIVDGEQDERQFPDWSMGFRDLHSPDTQRTPGFSEFMNTPLGAEEFRAQPTRAQRLLLLFKTHM